uniref:Uncharacterized protein n=1 Tax=Onchocerca volvulus TaxID=6282 RepID=A0A8R1Y694_ONCVO
MSDQKQVFFAIASNISDKIKQLRGIKKKVETKTGEDDEMIGPIAPVSDRSRLAEKRQRL